MEKPETIDAYIARFPDNVKNKLNQIRSTIKKHVPPETKEKISYGMPTFFLRKNLVHFAAFTKHIGFYPTPSGLEAFKEQISAYKHSKGAVQFPLDKPLPLDLIAKIVNFRVKENLSARR